MTHSSGPIPAGKAKVSGSENGAVVNRPALLFPHEGRVEALLDGGPDRKRRREVETVDDEVAAVPYTDLVDLREQVIGRVPGEHVGEAGFHAHAHQREESPFLPALVAGELLGAEEHAGDLVGPFGMRLGERHRHVEVVAVRVEGGCEYRRVESRIAHVDHHVGALSAREFRDCTGIRRVERVRDESRIGTALDRDLRARHVEIGDDDPFENVGFGRGLRHRRSDSTRADYENPHPITLRALRHERVTYPSARAARRRWKSITTLTIAAQKHHNEMNPLTVSHMRIGTATRFNTPSTEMSR